MRPWRISYGVDSHIACFAVQPRAVRLDRMEFYWTEAQIRKVGTAGTAAMVERWKSLSSGNLGVEIPIILASRYSSKNLTIAQRPGQVNVTEFLLCEDRPTLAVLLEEFGKRGPVFDEVLFTHELAHRIVSLDGFSAIGTADTQWHLAGGALYSLAQHSPILTLQRTNGIDGRPIFDKRASEIIRGYVEQVGLCGIYNVGADAITIADDILHASPELSEQLINRVLPAVPQIRTIAEEVVDCAKNYDLLDPDENLLFLRDAVQRIAPAVAWVEASGADAVKMEVAGLIDTQNLEGEPRSEIDDGDDEDDSK